MSGLIRKDNYNLFLKQSFYIIFIINYGFVSNEIKENRQFASVEQRRLADSRTDPLSSYIEEI